MDIVSAVANLVKERDYYKALHEEAKGVIKQIVEGPGNVEYIHPMDLAEIWNAHSLVDVAKLSQGNSSDTYEFMKSGKKYKQSILVPRKFKAKLV